MVTSEIIQCKHDGEKNILVTYTTDEATKLLCEKCFNHPTYHTNVKFAYNIKTQEEIKTQ